LNCLICCWAMAERSNRSLRSGAGTGRVSTGPKVTVTLPTCGPYQKRASVLPTLKVGHDAVHNMGFRREEVDGVDVGLRLPPVLDVLDVWMRQREAGRRTMALHL
jgi:hypothetical protein